MNKTGLVILREYLARVRKNTFIALTLLGPLLYILLIAAPIIISEAVDDEKTVEVIDETGLFADAFESSGNTKFIRSDLGAEEAEQKLQESGSSSFYLIIPEMDLFETQPVKLIGSQSPGIQLENTVRNRLNSHIETLRLKDFGLEDERIAALKQTISLETMVGSETGLVEAGTGIASAAGFISGFLIYFFIFAYGGMVLQSVQEEKSSRIVEIIVSSIKPFQLMLGKIAGIALVGLTQLLLWLILTFILLIAAGFVIIYGFPGLLDTNGAASPGMSAMIEGNPLLEQSFKTLGQINFPLLLSAFVFYFIGGYLIYASLFAAIGASVDNQNESQQFMLPVSVPLFFALLSIFPIADNPNGGFAFWLSMIPFTSPISMMTRLPFGVPIWELILSVLILIATFILITWLAGRIYRTGILLYGSKPSPMQMMKWMWRG